MIFLFYNESGEVRLFRIMILNQITVGCGEKNDDSDCNRSTDSGDFILSHDKKTNCSKIPPNTLTRIKSRYIILHAPGVKVIPSQWHLISECFSI
jgi:hypothetical protein